MAKSPQAALRIERRKLRHRAAGYERRTVGFLAAGRFASAILWGR
jgi:hypothetical protein